MKESTEDFLEILQKMEEDSEAPELTEMENLAFLAMKVSFRNSTLARSTYIAIDFLASAANCFGGTGIFLRGISNLADEIEKEAQKHPRYNPKEDKIAERFLSILTTGTINALISKKDEDENSSFSDKCEDCDRRETCDSLFKTP